MKPFSRALAVLGACSLLLFPPLAQGQMKAADGMKDFDSVFGVVLHQRSYPYDVTLVENHPAGNVLAPGEQPIFVFLFTNHLATPIVAKGKIDVVAYGTKAIAGNPWLPQVFKMADLAPVPIDVNLPANGSQLIEVRPTLPEKFGGYALIADLGPSGRRFATSCVRTFAPSAPEIEYPRMSLDLDMGVDVLQKLDIHAVRLGVPYVPTTSPHYEAAMAALDAQLRACAEKKITVMLEFGAGTDDPSPLGRGRPHLDANGVMLDTKQDLAWLPSSDADFQKFVATLCTKYGWPRGPVNGALLWNEPWEGISISGWGADSIRYREIFTAMAQGVAQARATGVEVLTAGCESTSNTLDKLFGDGSDTYLKWLDVCSIHYQGLAAPALFRKWIQRDSPYGRVKVWDTESWLANADDHFSAMMAMNRAAGYDRVMGIFGGNVATPLAEKVKFPDGSVRPVSTTEAWSPAVAVGATAHFVGDREFREILFKNGLPWVLVFDGLKDKPESGTVVVVGDVSDLYGSTALFRTVRGLAEAEDKEKLLAEIKALPADSPERAAKEAELVAKVPLSGALLTVKDDAHEFELHDIYGNLVPEENGVLKVPLDDRGFFLGTNGAPGSFERLVAALREARIDGYEPLEIVAHDLLAPIGEKPALHLTLTNILNRPVSGKVTVSLGKLGLDVPARLDFAAHEVKEVTIPLTAGEASPDNTYPLYVRFDAGDDGFAVHPENLHVNFIARKTIAVDGSLDDWKDVLPQPVQASADSGPSITEAAWFPFEKFGTAQQAGGATGYLSYDDKNFYFAAKVADANPSPGTIRFATRNDDDYFYPATSYEYDTAKTLLKTDETWTNPARADGALLLPGSPTQRSFTMWSSVSGAFAVDLNLAAGLSKRVTLYFVDPDDYKNGRRVTDVAVEDAASGKVLAEKTVSEYGPGDYVSFLISGKVRVVFRTKTWLHASLSGIFFDAADGKTVNGTAAKFLATDLTTRGAWQGKFGQEGYAIAGSEPKYPAYAQVTFPDVELKTAHVWPEGVRRFSYRKNPDVPFGSSPKFDNVQIAFNVIPEDQKADMILNPPGTMPRFSQYHDTDYEYALNPVAPAYGGGTEVWRSWVPGMVRKHFYPRQPASPFDGAVKDAQMAVKQDGDFRIYEAALPWTEIPLVHEAMETGKPIRFSFRINLAQGSGMELAQDRSVSKQNSYAFHPDWVTHWANEVEFRFQPPQGAAAQP